MFTPITGRAVVVTGASRGIGKGIARVFARQGAKVLVVSRKIEEAVLWRPQGGALEGTPNKWVRSGDPR